jgi:hypothetical protein
MDRKGKGRKRSGDMIEDRVSDLVDRSERKRIRQARSRAPDPELVDRMRELTDEDSVARSFLENALAEVNTRPRKNPARDQPQADHRRD